MTPFRWGIFGTGAVSAKFAAGLRALADAEATMVVSRSAEQARTFAGALGLPHAIEGYDAAVAAAPGLVDAIYIATPPALHREHALACIAAGLPVLIEKPFAPDAAAAREIVEAARTARVFCMEAMWTRFMPAATRLKALVAEGAVGEPHLVAGSFGISNRVDPAFGDFDPARGGGALAHLGVYPVSLGQWLFGAPVSAHAIGRLGETGVEEDVAMSLRYANGAVGAFHTSLRASASDFAVHGTHGSVALRGPIYRPWGVELRRATPRGAPAAGLSRKALAKEGAAYQRLGQVREMLRPAGRAERRFFAGNGYQYEAAEVASLVRAGATESPVMPLADSVAIAETLDVLRAQARSGR